MITLLSQPFKQNDKLYSVDGSIGLDKKFPLFRLNSIKDMHKNTYIDIKNTFHTCHLCGLSGSTKKSGDFYFHESCLSIVEHICHDKVLFKINDMKGYGTIITPYKEYLIIVLSDYIERYRVTSCLILNPSYSIFDLLYQLRYNFKDEDDYRRCFKCDYTGDNYTMLNDNQYCIDCCDNMKSFKNMVIIKYNLCQQLLITDLTNNIFFNILLVYNHVLSLYKL